MDTNERGNLIRIKLANMDDPRWTEQKDAVKALGASHQRDSRGTWLIEADDDTLPVDTLNRLYEIAAEYGTHIRIMPIND